MAKKKEEVKIEEKIVETPVEQPKILPITQEFGNGDLNILRDKINEIIGLK